MSGDSIETRNSRQTARVCATKGWKLCWNAWKTRSNRDHTNIANISAGIGFWTYVDWYFFAHLCEYYTTLKPVTFFFNTLYILGPSPESDHIAVCAGKTRCDVKFALKTPGEKLRLSCTNSWTAHFNGSGQIHISAALPPGENPPRYLLYTRLGEPQSWRERRKRTKIGNARRKGKERR
jgi:hypothetical protein